MATKGAKRESGVAGGLVAEVDRLVGLLPVVSKTAETQARVAAGAARLRELARVVFGEVEDAPKARAPLEKATKRIAALVDQLETDVALGIARIDRVDD